MGDKLSRRFTCLVHLLPVVPLLACGPGPAPVAPAPVASEPQPAVAATVAPPVTVPAAQPAESPGDGFALRYEGVSMQVALPMKGACVVFSEAGAFGPPCPRPEQPPAMPGTSMTAWTSPGRDGQVALIFVARTRREPLAAPRPATATEGVMELLLAGLNLAMRDRFGMELGRVRDRERTRTLPNGAIVTLMVMKAIAPPRSPEGLGSTHQVSIQIPGLRRLYNLTWSTNAERADEIEAMARKTFESVRFEEP